MKYHPPRMAISMPYINCQIKYKEMTSTLLMGQKVSGQLLSINPRRLLVTPTHYLSAQ
jgi:hypothetical protein